LSQLSTFRTFLRHPLKEHHNIIESTEMANEESWLEQVSEGFLSSGALSWSAYHNIYNCLYLKSAKALIALLPFSK